MINSNRMIERIVLKRNLHILFFSIRKGIKPDIGRKMFDIFIKKYHQIVLKIKWKKVYSFVDEKHRNIKAFS